MKIIQIIPALGLAGAEIMCENLVYELTKAGHQVVVVSLFEQHSAITERMEAADIDVRYLNKKPGLDLSMVRKLFRIFRKERPDVVHTHLYALKYMVPAAVLASVKKRVHTVHNIAEKETGGAARRLNRVFFKCCKVIPVALSDLVRDTIKKEYHLKVERIPVIFNGIDLSKCVPKEKYSVKDCFTILHIGRFSEQKNHRGLLEAFRVFHEKYPKSRLQLIGEGENRAEAESFVRKNGLEHAIEFLGLQKNVYGYMHEADVFVLPSLYEGVPMTLIEAMGSGLPIVATAVGGVPDMLDAESAILIDIDTKEIADAFERYYLDVELREKHGKEAKKRAVLFSAERMTRKYIRLYSGKEEEKQDV